MQVKNGQGNTIGTWGPTHRHEIIPSSIIMVLVGVGIGIPPQIPSPSPRPLSIQGWHYFSHGPSQHRMQFDVTLKASFGDCFAFSHSKLQTKENEELCPKKCKGVVLRSSRTIAKSECIIVFSQVVVSICKRRRRRVVAKEASKANIVSSPHGFCLGKSTLLFVA